MCAALSLAPLWAAPASAHATLEHTDPSPGQVLARPPAQVVLDFDEAVSLGTLGTLSVRDPAGRPAQRGAARLRAGGREVAVALRTGLSPGLYLVSYRVVSDDGHPVSGGFGFRVGAVTPHAPALGTTGGTSTTSPGPGPAVRLGFAAARFAGLAGLVLLVGGAVFLDLLWRQGRHLRRPRRLVAAGCALTAAAALAELVLEAPYAGGHGVADVTGAGIAQVLRSPFGTAHLVRLGALLTGWPVLVALLGGRPSRWARPAALVLGVVLVLSWPFSGHPAAQRPVLFVPLDALHTAATCVWVGGLVLLVGTLLPVADAPTLRGVLPRWSRLAMAAVAVIAITGVLQALIEIGAWSQLASTAYGRLVLAKLALLCALLAVANASRRWVLRHASLPVAYAATASQLRTPAPPRRPLSDRSRLRTSVWAEIVLAAATLGVASVLVQAAPPAAATAAAAPQPVGGPFSASVQRGGLVVQMVVAPAHPGTNVVSVALVRADGTPVRVNRWQVSATDPAGRVHPVPMAVITDHGFGEVRLPAAGSWRFTVTGREHSGRAVTLQERVAVR